VLEVFRQSNEHSTQSTFFQLLMDLKAYNYAASLSCLSCFGCLTRTTRGNRNPKPWSVVSRPVSFFPSSEPKVKRLLCSGLLQEPKN